MWVGKSKEKTTCDALIISFFLSFFFCPNLHADGKGEKKKKEIKKKEKESLQALKPLFHHC